MFVVLAVDTFSGQVDIEKFFNKEEAQKRYEYLTSIEQNGFDIRNEGTINLGYYLTEVLECIEEESIKTKEV